jgi:nucleoid-associated protein YgaU
LDWPSTATPSKAARPAHGHRAAPAASPKTGASGVPAHPSAPAPDRHVVVVRRGDTLWAIAAAHLPGDVDDAAIAAAWPRWYAANRAVVGPDPDLLLPGQRLHAPDPLSPPSAEDHAHGSTP